MKKNTIVILSSTMAGWLMFNRFGKVDEKNDWKNNGKKIYIFNDTPELRQCMEKYNEFKALLA
ncbi:DUF5659 domain-containing protein [Inediibacterium massiliense]|uniref:DUF5659 domain-containing protein n=1 Tax=Inediibacterium massiliense TaxID=1658111 RepID=UPI0006B5F856|nr:DUF5659 domain-containing protein [Inediibacterium massiliense]